MLSLLEDAKGLVLAPLLEKPRSQRGTGSSKPCTHRLFGMGEAGWSAQSGLSLHLSDELEGKEMFHSTSR